MAGLGNPGPDYQDTRHNAGFWFADEVARRYGGQFRSEAKFFGEVCRVSVAGRDCRLVKPNTYMNRSGQAVAALAQFFKIPVESVLVVHDELDLPPGAVRLKRGGGHGGHNGLRDLIARLGSKDFLRLRLGIGHPGHKDQVVDYVLHRASKEDETLIRQAIDDAADALPDILAGDHERVMNRLHRKA